MSTKIRKIMFMGNRAQLARRTDNLTAIYDPIVWTMWDPQHRPPWPVTETASLSLLFPPDRRIARHNGMTRNKCVRPMLEGDVEREQQGVRLQGEWFCWTSFRHCGVYVLMKVAFSRTRTDHAGPTLFRHSVSVPGQDIVFNLSESGCRVYLV
jgi:hypothetical protein